MPDQDNTFHIPSWNIPRLEKEIAKLNKRAAKIGCPPVEINTIREYQQVDPVVSGNSRYEGTPKEFLPQITVFEIEIVGEGPKIEGYKFIGTLDHITLPGSVVVNTVPGETVPAEFFNKKPLCNHCNKVRRRNETFILENEEGGYKQVGRNCIRDFFGHDPSAIASHLTRLIRFVESLRDEDDWGRGSGGGGRQDYVFPHNIILQATAAIIKKHGWVPRSACNEENTATVSHVYSFFFPPTSFAPAAEVAAWHAWKDSLDATNDKYVREAEESRTWLNEQEGSNEYMHNLHMIDQAEEVPTRMFGYWCSLVAAYQRDQERLRVNKAQKKTNEWAGDVKQRLDFNVTVVGIRYIEGYYGTIELHKMVDDKGRTLTWFANTRANMEKGCKYKIKGTVKKLDEYKDWKQTVLSRVKVLEEIKSESA